MPTTIWIGNIHFRGTSVPVRLHTAVSQNRVRFHLLHKRDKARLRQQLVCAYENKPVAADEQVKGFRLEGRKYILLDPDELERSEPSGGRNIEVHEFVKAGEIDPVFLERTYYLEPEGPSGGYGALACALKETGAEGVCTWVMRKRAYLGAISSTGATLRLNVLRYADELIPAGSLGLKEFAVTEKELDIGTQLIGRLAVRFQPKKYKDEHQEKLRQLIEKKARGEKIALPKPRRLKSTEGEKLLAALEESLKAAA